MESRIGIGTVQFGKDYGINNTSGIVSESEICKILDFALANGIKFLDTATSYGKSEEILGLYSRIEEFEIVTKLSAKVNSIEREIKKSLNLLNVKILDGCLFHDFKTFLNNEIYYDQLVKLKREGSVKKIGFSVYYPSELEYLLNKGIEIDIIQLPYNVFDRRFEYLFVRLKEKNIDIHIRSVFLQGLFFIKYEKLSKHFVGVKDLIKELQDFCLSNNISVGDFLLTFVMKNLNCDKFILGINNLQEIKENLKLEREPILFLREFNFDHYKVEDENILIPYLWK